MTLQILRGFLVTTLLLPLSQGTRAHPSQPLGRHAFFLNLDIRNHLPPTKHKLLLFPDSVLKIQNPFCQGGCQDGWMSYTDRCYMYVPEPRSWPEAERTCQSLAPGGHVTSISSAEHKDFLVQLATFLAQKSTLFWIGGSHRKGGSLQWTDGTKTNFIQRPVRSLRHFMGGKIQHIVQRNPHVCLQVSLRGHGRWDGTNCQRKLPFICSYKPDLTPP